MEDCINDMVEKLGEVSSLNADYCKRCASSEYSNYDQLSSDFDCELYQNEEVTTHLIMVVQNVRAYCISHSDTSTFFESLHAAGIEVQKLTTFLWYCIDSGLQSNRTKVSLEKALAASSLYLALTSIKSAKLYRLYDISLFQKCIDLLKVTEKILRPLGSKITSVLQPKKRGANEPPERNDPLDIGDEIDRYVLQLKNVMRSLFVAFNSHSIADAVLENDERCPTIVDFLRDVIYFDVYGSISPEKRMLGSIETINRASELSFAIAHQILAKNSELRSLTVASRFVMPFLLFWICGSSKLKVAGSLPQVLKDASTATVRFLEIRVDSLTKSEMNCYIKVMKTLPFKCADRANYRASVAETFVDVIVPMPQLAYFLFDDVYVLGRHKHDRHRSFAYEIVNFLLKKFPWDNIPNPPIPYDALLMEEENIALNEDEIEEVEEVEEVVDAEMTEEGEAQNEEANNENGDAEMADETNGEATDQNPEQAAEQEEVLGPPPFRANAEQRSIDDLEYVRDGMTPREAMLMLIINGLIDKKAKQKALHTVESLFKDFKCIPDLCKLATKFVNENYEELNLVGRMPAIKNEPMDDSMEGIEENNPQLVENDACDDLLYLILKGFENDTTAICKQALSTCCTVLLRAHVQDQKLFERCVEEIRLKTWDIVVTVRKQAAVSLKELLTDSVIGKLSTVEHAWLSGLLHQVMDNEEGVKQQAIKIVTEYIVDGLLKPRPNPTWDLMEIVEGNAEYTRYLAICFTEHANNTTNAARGSGTIQNLIQQLVRLLVRLTRDEDCPASAWMLLAELSHRLAVDPECAKVAWDRLDLNRADDRIPVYLARIIANRCNSLEPDVRDELKTKIGRQIKNNAIAVSHISAVCYAFACLCKGVLPNGGKGNKEGLQEIASFVQSYNKQVSKFLNESLMLQIRRDVASRAATNTPSVAAASQQTLQNPLNSQASPETIMKSVYTVGELIQYAPGKIDPIIFNLLRTIVATSKIDIDTQIPSQHLPQIASDKVVPRSVRAAAVLALGRMSVVDESIAKQIVSVLTRQLRQDTDHCVRNIILIAMADICTIGTASVDKYGDILASCMRDPSILIRKHAVFLVTALIRDEYFKWKGQIMYFFLGALLDPDASVREQVHASLLNVLMPKFPNMFINHFVEAMFHLNDVIHPAMAVTIKHEQENCPLERDDRFTLFGNSRMENRIQIYRFMILTFGDAQKLALLSRISLEVFEAISEESIDILDRNVVCLLLDALKIFRSKEMVLKFDTGKKAEGADEADEETEEGERAKAVATDVITFSYMRMVGQDMLARLFKVREFLKASFEPSHIELAKKCHSTILDYFEFYLDHFDSLIGNDFQRRGEIRDDLVRLRKKNVPNA